MPLKGDGRAPRSRGEEWREAAERILPGEARAVRARLVSSQLSASERVGDEATDFAVAIACAYPAT